jgi:hypothetical protein
VWVVIVACACPRRPQTLDKLIELALLYLGDVLVANLRECVISAQQPRLGRVGLGPKRVALGTNPGAHWLVRFGGRGRGSRSKEATMARIRLKSITTLLVAGAAAAGVAAAPIAAAAPASAQPARIAPAPMDPGWGCDCHGWGWGGDDNRGWGGGWWWPHWGWGGGDWQGGNWQGDNQQ